MSFQIPPPGDPEWSRFVQRLRDRAAASRSVEDSSDNTPTDAVDAQRAASVWDNEALTSNAVELRILYKVSDGIGTVLALVKARAAQVARRLRGLDPVGGQLRRHHAFGEPLRVSVVITEHEGTPLATLTHSDATFWLVLVALSNGDLDAPAPFRTADGGIQTQCWGPAEGDVHIPLPRDATTAWCFASDAEFVTGSNQSAEQVLAQLQGVAENLVLIECVINASQP